MEEVLAWLREGWWWVALAVQVLAVASIPSVLLQRRARPMAALSWILALVAIPIFGLLAWWLVGRVHLHRKRRKRRLATKAMVARLSQVRTCSTDSEMELLPIRKLPADLEHAIFPCATNNTVDLLIDGEAAYDTMEAAIRSAEHHVHFLFYIWNADKTGRRFRDLLIERAKEGVEVRALFDPVGSPSITRRFLAPLRRAGARVEAFVPLRVWKFLPMLNFRNHRKILIIDGKVGFIGGFNIGDEYLGAWHDLGFRMSGPAIEQLQEVFASDWYFVTNEDLAEPKYFVYEEGDESEGDAVCSVVASGPDVEPNPMHDVVFMAINQARERVYIMTPYFIPTSPIMTALRAAVYRGVDVRVMLPAKSDVPLVQMASRSYFTDLLNVGVRLFEFQPAFLHAKALLFDDELSLVGSANMDTRSFRLNFEVSCVVSDRQLSDALAELFARDISKCKEIQPGDIAKRLWPVRVFDAAAHLLSPLL